LAPSAKKPSGKQAGMPDGMKKSLLITAACIVVAGSGIWAYMTLTTISPPPPAKSTPENVTDFLGNSRGFARMPVNRRADYMADAIQRFSSDPDSLQRFHRSLNRMTRKQREVFTDAVFDAGRVQFMDKAREYNRMSPHNRHRFIDQTIRDFETLQSKFAGPPGAGSLGKVFEKDMPRNTDEWMKFIVTKTSPRERAEAEDLFDALAARHKELEDPRERRRFNSGR
jgi:hypothetical protein